MDQSLILIYVGIIIIKSLKDITMKKLCIYLIASIIYFNLSSQNEVIDLSNPINKFDVGYSPDDRLIFTLYLNSNVNSRSLLDGLFNTSASAEGTIEWQRPETDENKMKFKAVFNQSRTSPLVYIADIKDLTDVALKISPTTKPGSNDWLRLIDVKIKVKINDKVIEMPFLSVYPPNKSIKSIVQPTIVINNAKITGPTTGVISVSTNSTGLQFEVLRIELIREGQTMVIDTDKLGNNRFANDGKIDIRFTSDFNLRTDGPYSLSVKVKKIGFNDTLSLVGHSIYFLDETRRRILEVNPGNAPFILDDNDVFVFTLRTEGQEGDIGLKFTSPEYTSNIKFIKTYLGSGDFEVILSNLKSLPENSSSHFYFTINGVEEEPYYKIMKRGPEVRDLKFVNTRSSTLAFEFNMPNSMKKDKISVQVSRGIGLDYLVSGDKIIKTQDNSYKYKVELPSEATRFNSDTLINIRMTILYDTKSIYSLGMELFNQKLLNDKVSELIAETAKNGKKDKTKITSILNGILNIGKAIGNSIDDEEVTKAVEGLSSGNKEKIKNTMSDVGKWAIIVGKILVPVLI